MDHHTCKFYNGDFHNTCCLAGVPYRDITTDPDRIDGVAFRKPCIDWDSWHKERGDDFNNEAQRQNWQIRGHCDKREVPTQAEIDAEDTEHNKRITEVLESLNRGVVPSGVLVCGPSTIGKCKCSCPKSCEHLWDGPVVHDEDPDSAEIMGNEYVPAPLTTATCSRCGMWAINHDMWM